MRLVTCVTQDPVSFHFQRHGRAGQSRSLRVRQFHEPCQLGSPRSQAPNYRPMHELPTIAERSRQLGALPFRNLGTPEGLRSRNPPPALRLAPSVLILPRHARPNESQQPDVAGIPFDVRLTTWLRIPYAARPAMAAPEDDQARLDCAGLQQEAQKHCPFVTSQPVETRTSGERGHSRGRAAATTQGSSACRTGGVWQRCVIRGRLCPFGDSNCD